MQDPANTHKTTRLEHAACQFAISSVIWHASMAPKFAGDVTFNQNTNPT